MTATDHLISTEQLAARLDDPDTAVLDATWYLPGVEGDGRAEYETGHIPGAVFFDIEALSDRTSDLPHMLPQPEVIAPLLGRLGLGDGMTIVVYDTHGIYSAPRVWWTLRALGARDVRVLDGGLPKWKAEGRPVEAGMAEPAPRRFTARRKGDLVRVLGEMRDELAREPHMRAQIVDARPAARFHGQTPEPRPGVRPGHIPGSLNLPAGQLLTPDGRMKAPDALAGVFRAAGVDPSRPIVTTCGSGVSASTVSLALAVLSGADAPVYDGSWSEWGARDELPAETG